MSDKDRGYLWVDSAEACKGRGGTYEAWIHHWSDAANSKGKSVATLSRFVLSGVYRDAEELLDAPDALHPYAIFGLAENVKGQALMRIGTPAVTSVVRKCYRVVHGAAEPDDGRGLHSWRLRVRPRLEVVSRTVWLPESAERVLVRAALRISDEGIGMARTADTPSVAKGPVVSGPITAEEAAYARDLPTATIVESLAVNSRGKPLYVVLHPRPGGAGDAPALIERLYVPGEEHLAELA
jgi:hypothetical protein